MSKRDMDAAAILELVPTGDEIWCWRSMLELCGEAMPALFWAVMTQTVFPSSVLCAGSSAAARWAAAADNRVANWLAIGPHIRGIGGETPGEIAGGRAGWMTGGDVLSALLCGAYEPVWRGGPPVWQPMLLSSLLPIPARLPRDRQFVPRPDRVCAQLNELARRHPGIALGLVTIGVPYTGTFRRLTFGQLETFCRDRPEEAATWFSSPVALELAQRLPADHVTVFDVLAWMWGHVGDPGQPGLRYYFPDGSAVPEFHPMSPRGYAPAGPAAAKEPQT